MRCFNPHDMHEMKLQSIHSRVRMHLLRQSHLDRTHPEFHALLPRIEALLDQTRSQHPRLLRHELLSPESTSVSFPAGVTGRRTVNRSLPPHSGILIYQGISQLVYARRLLCRCQGQ